MTRIEFELEPGEAKAGIIDPIYRLAIQGDALADAWWELLVGLGIAGALTAGGVALARRMHARLAAG